MNNIAEPNQADGYSEYLCRACKSFVPPHEAIGQQDDGTCDACPNCLEPAALRTTSAPSGLICVKCGQQPTEARVAWRYGGGRCLCADCQVTWRFEQAIRGETGSIDQLIAALPVYDEHDGTDGGGQ